MNRAWMALAGLAMVGVGALNYQLRPYDWPDGPAYVAEASPLSPSECRGWQSRAARRAAAGFAGSWEAFEGFSRLQGACHPQDREEGRALIEAALAKGAGRYLVVEYVLALRGVGDVSRANAELPVAAEVMRPWFARRRQWFRWTPDVWDPLLQDALDELRVPLTARDWAPLKARVDHLVGRAAWVPDAEQVVLFRLLYAMQSFDYVEALFQAYVAQAAGRYDDRLGLNHALNRAASCGHPTAIRIQARQVIDGELPRAQAWDVRTNVLWLHARTNAEGDLLRGLEPNFSWGNRAASDIQRRNEWIATRCGERRD